MSLLLFGTGEEESMAAPTFVTHATTSVSASTSLTITKPAEVQDGDYLLVHIQHGTGNLAADPTAPSGWSLISPGRQANASTTGWFYEKIASGEPASWDWTDFSSGVIFGGIVVSRGADQTTPRNQTHILQNTNIGGTSVALTVTNTVADCLLVAFAGQDQTAAGATFTQASMTELYDADFTASLLHCGAYHETATTATTYARTISYTAERCCGALFAIAPSSGADATPTPSAIASTVAAPQATPSVSDTAAPDVIASTTSAPQATPTVSGSSAPTAVTGAVALPQATVTGNAAVSPSAISAAVTLPSSAREIGAGPAMIPVVVALPQATPTSAGNATATPAAVTALVSVPQAAASGTAVASPTGIATVVSTPQATPQGNATTAPAAIVSTVSAPAAQATVGDVAAPSVIAAFAAPLQASPLGSATVSPDAIVTVVTLPIPHLTEPRDIVVIARLRGNHITGSVRPSGLIAGLRSNHITGGVRVPRDLYTGSLEYVIADVTFKGETAASIVTATGVVQFRTDDVVPAPGDPGWVAPDVTERTDVSGGALLALKKNHTAGVAGEYRVWAKVSDNPEVPILKCGTFTVR